MNTYDELKKILFGNQKQGDAINTAVVNLVGQVLDHNTRGEWPARIKEYSEEEFKKSNPNLNILSLIYGVGIYDIAGVLKDAHVECTKPYSDSPKYVFTAVTSEGLRVSLDTDVESSETDVVSSDVEVSSVSYEADDHVARAIAVKNKVYPFVPESVKACFTGELGEWQAALLFCDQYL